MLTEMTKKTAVISIFFFISNDFASFLFFGMHLSLPLCLNLIESHTPSLQQTVMVSLEGLSKIVDPSQLTADFEGSLEYNHDDWIEVWNFFTFHLSKLAKKRPKRPSAL